MYCSPDPYYFLPNVFGRFLFILLFCYDKSNETALNIYVFDNLRNKLLIYDLEQRTVWL